MLEGKILNSPKDTINGQQNRGTPTQKEKDMERARPPLKERTVQHDRHSSNISTNNLRTKEISYGSIKNLAAKLDKSTSNEPERKMRFIEELDKIFKIKRQSPAEMNANLNPMRQSKEVHQSFRNVSDVIVHLLCNKSLL